jgi:hypothetical protein
MKTSELIALLTAEMEDHGDLPAVAYDDRNSEDLHIVSVEYNDDEGDTPVILVYVAPPPPTDAPS